MLLPAAGVVFAVTFWLVPAVNWTKRCAVKDQSQPEPLWPKKVLPHTINQKGSQNIIENINVDDVFGEPAKMENWTTKSRYPHIKCRKTPYYIKYGGYLAPHI